MKLSLHPTLTHPRAAVTHPTHCSHQCACDTARNTASMWFFLAPYMICPGLCLCLDSAITFCLSDLSKKECVRAFLMCSCVCVCSPCSVSSAGNVTPVPGIAASLDPGNSDDRNRRLLPLRRAYCLATGSLHTRPKPLPKASYSFAAILFLTSVPLVPLVVLSFCSLNDPDLLFNPVLLLFLPVVH